MSNDGANERFERTSFLYGANATFVEQLHARYQENPEAVDPEWRAFFEGLGDAPEDVMKEARGAPRQRSGRPPVANGELVSALHAHWPAAGSQVKAEIP